ncbi:GntR family transcriptional regulator [Sinorhizobium meliloti CCBAU 01290]|nr:GntR family transcriptional regulator [Sinorhizobium meliloti CCBAU 01290]
MPATISHKGVARLSRATSTLAGGFMSSRSLGTVARTIVDIVPYAGFRAFYFLRSAVWLLVAAYGLAAETAAQVATSKEIEALERILRESELAIEAGDRLKGTQLNQAFHFMLPQIAGLPVLNGILRRLWLQMGPHISDAYIKGGRAMIEHHYPVVEALKRHDSAAASMAIVDDILLGGKPILAPIARGTAPQARPA